MGSFVDYLSKFDLWSNLDIDILYSWLPEDIAQFFYAILAVLFAMAVVGFVRKWIPLS